MPRVPIGERLSRRTSGQANVSRRLPQSDQLGRRLYRRPHVTRAADALAFVLRFHGRKRVITAYEYMAQITAARLCEHLRQSEFVIMRKPPSLDRLLDRKQDRVRVEMAVLSMRANS